MQVGHKGVGWHSGKQTQSAPRDGVPGESVHIPCDFLGLD